MELILKNFTSFKINKFFFEKNLSSIKECISFKEIENFSVGVILVGQRRIREINKRYRGKNQVTTVLSFLLEEIKKPTKKTINFIEPNQEEKLLGEILLCPSRIKKISQREKKDFKEELAFYFIHGFLHLLGYEHKDTKTTKEMKEKEREILKKLKNKK